jgi:hypothetical protein
MATDKLKSPESKTQKSSPSKIARLIEIAQLAAAGVPLDTEQAAGYLQVAPGTLSVWRCIGKGPKFILCGTSPRYTKQALDEWIGSCTTQRRASPNVGRPPGRGLARRKAARR